MKIFFLTLVILFSVSLSAQKQVFSNKIEKIFPVNTSTFFTINNKNGNIDFEIWEKHEIKIEVIFKVNTVKVEKAPIYLQAFSLKIEKDSNNINVTSVVNDHFLDKTFRNGKSDFEINYLIKHPVYLNINVYNRFGNVNMNELSGNLYVNLKYGKFFVNNLTSDESKRIPRFELNYSKCTILKANGLDINANYSTVNIKKALSLNINSSYSEITTDNVFLATVKSKYDRVRFTEVSKLNANANYSKFTIDFLKTEMSFVAKYTPLSINELSDEFSSLWLDVTYSDVDIQVPHSICFSINAEAKFGKILLPKRSNVNNYISYKTIKTVGTVGCVLGAKRQLNANATFCDINISEK